jgi:flagellar biosynthesis/type III secretory pathway protein FliH
MREDRVETRTVTPVAWSELFDERTPTRFRPLIAPDNDIGLPDDAIEGTGLQDLKDTVTDSSWQAGFAAGQLEAVTTMDQAVVETLSLLQAVHTAISETSFDHSAIIPLLNRVVMRLVENVLDTQLALKPDIILARIESGILALGDTVGSCQLLLHPEDYTTVAGHLQQLDIKAQPDATLAKGTVHLVSAESILDDRLHTRLALLQNKLGMTTP